LNAAPLEQELDQAASDLRVALAGLDHVEHALAVGDDTTVDDLTAAEGRVRWARRRLAGVQERARRAAVVAHQRRIDEVLSAAREELVGDKRRAAIGDKLTTITTAIAELNVLVDSHNATIEAYGRELDNLGVAPPLGLYGIAPDRRLRLGDGMSVAPLDENGLIAWAIHAAYIRDGRRIANHPLAAAAVRTDGRSERSRGLGAPFVDASAGEADRT
jgi:hypothetical protein